MNDIAAAGGGKAEIKKGIKNCANIKKEKKIRYGLKKTICMMVKTLRERRDSKRKCKIRNSTKNSNVPVLWNNNKLERKPRITYNKDKSNKM